MTAVIQQWNYLRAHHAEFFLQILFVFFTLIDLGKQFYPDESRYGRFERLAGGFRAHHHFRNGSVASRHSGIKTRSDSAIGLGISIRNLGQLVAILFVLPGGAAHRQLSGWYAECTDTSFHDHNRCFVFLAQNPDTQDFGCLRGFFGCSVFVFFTTIASSI